MPASLSQSRISANGFTLVEILLYLSLSATLLLSISFLLLMMFRGQTERQVIAEVEEQGQFALEVLTQAIRNADSITVPGTVGVSSTSLTLAMASSTVNPTVFTMTSGTLRIIKGTGASTLVTSSRVAMSGLSILNVSRTGTPGALRIQFTLTYVTSTNSQEYSYAQIFTGSATLR